MSGWVVSYTKFWCAVIVIYLELDFALEQCTTDPDFTLMNCDLFFLIFYYLYFSFPFSFDFKGLFSSVLKKTFL